MNHETGYKVHLFEIEAQETLAPEQLSRGKPPRIYIYIYLYMKTLKPPGVPGSSRERPSEASRSSRELQGI